MKAVIQRVLEASVSISGHVHSEIGPGMLVLVGLEQGDGQPDVDRMVNKIAGLRIFEDEDGKMNRSVVDAGGSILMVSQFTIAGSIEKGRRPSFDHAMDPDQARSLFDYAVTRMEASGIPVKTGSFGAMMRVALINDGPATFLYDREPGT